MKTVKEIFLEAYQHSLIKGEDLPGTTYLSKMDTRRPAKFPPEKDIPNVLTLVRKAIRVYPDNQKIALYYSQALDKYLSIPYGPDNKAMGIHLSEATQEEKEKLRRQKLSKWVPRKKDDKRFNFEPGVSQKLKDIYKKEKQISSKDILHSMEDPRDIIDTREKGSFGIAVRKAIRGRGTGAAIGATLGLATRKLGKSLTAGARKAKEAVGLEEQYISPSDRFKLNIQHIREEKQQLNEFLPALLAAPEAIAGIATAARIAAPQVARFAARNVPRLASKAKDVAIAAGSKGKDLLKRVIDKVRGKGKGKNKKPKNNKKSDAGTGFGTGVATGAALADAASGSNDSSALSLFKKTEPAQFGYLKPEISRGTSAFDNPTYQFGTRKLTASKMQENINNFDKIKVISESKKSDVITFDDISIPVNSRIAKKIIHLYESLNKNNKNKVKAMLDEDVNSFRKIINFALRQ